MLKPTTNLSDPTHIVICFHSGWRIKEENHADLTAAYMQSSLQTFPYQTAEGDKKSWFGKRSFHMYYAVLFAFEYVISNHTCILLNLSCNHHVAYIWLLPVPSCPQPGDASEVLYDAKIRLSTQAMTEIDALLEGEDRWRTGALDNAISQILVDLKPHDKEAWKWRFEDTFGLELDTLLKVSLFINLFVCKSLKTFSDT